MAEWSHGNNKHGVSVIDKSRCRDLANAFSCEVYDNAQKIKYSGADIQSRPQIVQCDDYISGRKRRDVYQEFIPRRQFSKIQNHKSKSPPKLVDKTIITSTAVQKYSAPTPKMIINPLPNSISNMNDFVMINEPSERSFRTDCDLRSSFFIDRLHQCW